MGNQAEENKRKQRFLLRNGVNVKVDGSWGPWQQAQYEKLTSKERSLQTPPVRFNTTGGAGYIPPTDASTVTDIIDSASDRISNLWSYGVNYIKSKFFPGDGTFIDLSNKNVSRINSNTKGVKTILTNEFVEGDNRNTIRKKRDYVNTQDTLLGDRNIPLSKISTFYGVEDGKLKAGPISQFKDETVIVPNRAKNIGKIKKIIFNEDKYKERLEELLNYTNKNFGYKPGLIQKLIPPLNDPRITLIANRGLRGYKILKEAERDVASWVPPQAITEKGDTINLPNLNATPKILFANEQGNAAFVANLSNQENLKKLNDFLSRNPAYPVMVDNGRYSVYMDMAPNAQIYSGLNSPDDMYIVGTTQYKYGGKLIPHKNNAK